MLGPSAHIDTFARDNLPALDLLPDFKLGSFQYPEKLNAGYEPVSYTHLTLPTILLV